MKDVSPSKWFGTWLDKIRTWPEAYYDKTTRMKFKWALEEHYRDRESVDCPFSICRSMSGEVFMFPTKVVFMRHLVTNHMHHAPAYKCDEKRGKSNAKCEGCVVYRRSELARHLVDAHSLGIVDAGKKVVAL